MELLFPVYTALAAVFPLGLLYLGVRAVRAFERRSGSRGEIAELRARLAQLEDEVAGNSREIARVAEVQQFDRSLLAGPRGSAPGGSPPAAPDSGGGAPAA